MYYIFSPLVQYGWNNRKRMRLKPTEAANCLLTLVALPSFCILHCNAHRITVSCECHLPATAIANIPCGSHTLFISCPYSCKFIQRPKNQRSIAELTNKVRCSGKPSVLAYFKTYFIETIAVPKNPLWFPPGLNEEPKGRVLRQSGFKTPSFWLH